MSSYPFPKSWRVSPPLLLAGCYPGSLDETEAKSKLTGMLNAGIRIVISLQEEQEARRLSPYEPTLRELAASKEITVQCERFPIQDNGIPSPHLMNQILDRIDQAIEQKLPVYVHCWGGHGRTATVIGCWLVRHALSGEAALSLIKGLRMHDSYLLSQPAFQTAEQVAFVREWPYARS